MYSWFFISSALFVLAQSQQFIFGQDRDMLFNCIESHLGNEDFNLKSKEYLQFIVDIISGRLYDKTLERSKFYATVSTLASDIKRKKSQWFYDGLMPEKLKLAIRRATENCVEIKIPRYNLPIFYHEPRELADILDYILVDWPIPPNEMIRSQNGRSILRRYAYATGVRLVSALRYFSMDYNRFRQQFRIAWMFRAQQYFDGQSTIVSYPRYRFTTIEDNQNKSISEVIYTIDNPKFLVHRGTCNFMERDPLAQKRDTKKYLNIHLMCLKNERNYQLTEYLECDMSKAQYYIESHVDQCYRIMFFILELQARGINIDGDDTFNENIPYSVLPLFVQEIVGLDEAYREYLLSLRLHLERFKNEEFQECLSSNSDEYLIMMLVQWILKSSPSTSSTINITSDNGNGTKKGGVRLRECGKHFLSNKKLKTTFSEQKQEKSSEGENYGYVMYSKNSELSSDEIQNGMLRFIHLGTLNWTSEIKNNFEG